MPMFERVGNNLRCVECGHFTSEFSAPVHRCNFIVKPMSIQEFIEHQMERNLMIEGYQEINDAERGDDQD